MPITKHCPNLKKISFGSGKSGEIELLAKNCPHLTSFTSGEISIYDLRSLVEQNIHLTELVVTVGDNYSWRLRKHLKSTLLTIAKKFPLLETLKIRDICPNIPKELYQLPYLKKLGLVSSKQEGAKRH